MPRPEVHSRGMRASAAAHPASRASWSPARGPARNPARPSPPRRPGSPLASPKRRFLALSSGRAAPVPAAAARTASSAPPADAFVKQQVAPPPSPAAGRAAPAALLQRAMALDTITVAKWVLAAAGTHLRAKNCVAAAAHTAPVKAPLFHADPHPTPPGSTTSLPAQPRSSCCPTSACTSNATSAGRRGASGEHADQDCGCNAVQHGAVQLRAMRRSTAPLHFKPLHLHAAARAAQQQNRAHAERRPRRRPLHPCPTGSSRACAPGSPRPVPSCSAPSPTACASTGRCSSRAMPPRRCCVAAWGSSLAASRRLPGCCCCRKPWGRRSA